MLRRHLSSFLNPKLAFFFLLALPGLSGFPGLSLPLAAQTGPGDAVADHVLGQSTFAGMAMNQTDRSSLALPDALAVDRHVTPNRLYVSDSLNNRVLGYRDAEGFRLGAQPDLIFGQPDPFQNGCNTGGLGRGSLCTGRGLAVDGQGNLYVTDSSNARVLEFDSPFDNDTLADRVFGQPDFTTGGSHCPVFGSFCLPGQLTLDSAGNLFVADVQGVVEFDRPLVTDTLPDRVFGRSAFAAPCPTGEPCVETPAGVAVNAAGDLFVSDIARHDVRIYRAALTTDAVPDGELGHYDPAAPGNGCSNIPPSDANFCGPWHLAIGPDGTLYVDDKGHHRILAFSDPLAPSPHADGVLGGGGFTAQANSCFFPNTDSVTFCVPGGLAVDGFGNVFVADTGNNRVLRFPPSALPDSGFATAVLGQPGFIWTGLNGIDRRALAFPAAVALDTHSSPHALYVLDAGNSRVLGWRDAKSFANGQAADLWIGQRDPFTAGCNAPGRGQPGTDTLCTIGANSDPVGGLAVDSRGNLYVADSFNHRVLEYDAPFAHDPVADRVYGQSGFRTKACNQGGRGAGTLCRPLAVAVDRADNLYIADAENNRVVEYLNPLRDTRTADRVIGQRGFLQGQCPAKIDATSLCFPSGLASGDSGKLWVSDGEHSRVLRFPPSAFGRREERADLVLGQNGHFDTGVCDGGATSEDSLCHMTGLALGPDGSLWVAEPIRGRVVQFERLEGRPRLGTILGLESYHSGEPANASMLFGPAGVAVDTDGEVFVADQALHRVLAYDQP